MKKYRLLFLIFLILFILISRAEVGLCKENNIDIYVNGKEVNFNNKPIIKNSTLLFPLRELFEHLYFNEKEINFISDNCKKKNYGEFINDVQMVPVQIVNGCDYIKVSGSGNKVNFEVDNFKIIFIDNLYGNSIYIKDNDYDVLVNSGNESDEQRIKAFLNDNIYDKLDLVLASDFNKSHIGQMAYIINNYNVNEFLYPSGNSDTVLYENMIDALLGKKVASSKMSNKESKTYKLGKDRSLEVQELDGKLICKVKQGNKQVLLLNSIEKSSQYFLAEGDGNAEVIQIDNVEQLALPLVRRMKPDVIITYKFDKFSNINTKNYIKNNSIKVKEFGQNRDYANITIKDGKFITTYDTVKDNNYNNNKFMKIFFGFIIFVMVCLIISMLIKFYKESKTNEEDCKNERYKSILSKFIGLCNFKWDKMYSFIFYFLFLFSLVLGIALNADRQESMNNNINYLVLALVLISFVIVYCIITLFIISISHGWQNISECLRRNKEINKNDSLYSIIGIPIMITVIHMTFFVWNERQIDLANYELLYVFLALLFVSINYIFLFRGIILSMVSTTFSTSIRVMSANIHLSTKRDLSKKRSSQYIRRQLQMKLSIILTWFIMIYLNSVAFLYMISRIPNNSFIETASGKAADLFGIFYFTIITVFTIGYGDIIPVGLFARGGVVILTLIGGFFTLLAIGQILNVEEIK